MEYVSICAHFKFAVLLQQITVEPPFFKKKNLTPKNGAFKGELLCTILNLNTEEEEEKPRSPRMDEQIGSFLT